VGRGRGVHGKENPRKFYAVGLRIEPTPIVPGSSRRITIMRLRPAKFGFEDIDENSFTKPISLIRSHLPDLFHDMWHEARSLRSLYSSRREVLSIFCNTAGGSRPVCSKPAKS
jgi:hypothetical protein